MPKQITLAKFAGFCYGVKRAVETVKKLKAENPDKNVSVLGELIHNTDVIEELEALGIKTLKEIPAHVLRPLIAETTAKALSADRAADVQTGPARRGDFSTQERHLNMLADRPDLQQIYQNISHNIWETSKKT